MSDHDFNTDPELLDLIRTLSPTRQIGLDPCSNATSMVRARKTYDIVTNGLAHPWRNEGLVFVNPPHSKSPYHIEPWMEKAALEFLLPKRDPEYHGNKDQLVMYIPAKTDTLWFHSHTTRFTVRCFLRGRRRYWQNGALTEGNGKFAQMVLYHGPNIGLFMSLFDSMGWVV